MNEKNIQSAKERFNQQAEITVTIINKENPLERRRLRKIWDDPKTNRHTININDEEKPTTKKEKDKEFRDWLNENTVYGIYKTVNGKRKLMSAAFFYKYEEEEPPPNEKPEDHSETIQEMIETGVIPGPMVPKIENTEEIDLSKIQEASIFMPENAEIDELGQGARKALQEYVKNNQLPKNTLILFFRLQKQNQSTAKRSDYATPSLYEKELEEEKKILSRAGFVHWADIEHGDVGISTFIV